MGFPSSVPQCATSTCSCVTRERNGPGRVSTLIIPEMSFTCSGTHLREAGEFRNAGNARINSVLSIWREREVVNLGPMIGSIWKFNWEVVEVKI